MHILCGQAFFNPQAINDRQLVVDPGQPTLVKIRMSNGRVARIMPREPGNTSTGR